MYLPRSANGKPSWLCALRAKLYFIYLAGGEMRPSRDPIEKIVECCVTFDYTLRVHHVNLTVESGINLPFLAPPGIRENIFASISRKGECENLREKSTVN